MTTKPTQRSEIQGFSKGLFTEYNPLNSQLDTTIDEVNFELNRNGTRSRRLGMDAEPNYNPFITTYNVVDAAVNSFLWKGVAGNPSIQFYVSRVGAQITFWELGSGSPSTPVGSIALDIDQRNPISFASVQGFLVIASGTPNLTLLSYDPQNKLFNKSNFRLMIRDLFGVEETVDSLFETDPGYRGPLNWQHYYNLYNQGWAIPRRPWSPVDSEAVDVVSLATYGDKVPANGDKVWTGMTQRPRSNPDLNTFEAFNRDQYLAITGVDGYVSRGYFIIDAFNRGSSRTEAWQAHKNKYPQTGNLVWFQDLPADVTSGGPTSVATHAGRIFYSGINGVITGGDKRSPNYNNYLFFSRLIKNQQDFGKCYQEGDPTSRESNDLVDTDGGYIVIPEAINIHTMYSMGDKLFLIADNGVWTVAGGSDYGFTTTNYKVTRLSTFGGTVGGSFVELNNNGFFWGSDGIYSITQNQFGDWTVDNITKTTIDTFFRKIPSEAHFTVQGFTDKHLNQVRWVYREGTIFNDSVCKELVLDMNFKAFIPITFANTPTNSVAVLNGTHGGDYSIQAISNNVMSDGKSVKVGGNQVVLPGIAAKTLATNSKYLVVQYMGNYLRLVMCDYRNTNYEDWAFTGTPVDAPASMTTNTFTGGDFAIKKQVPYLTMAFAETEKTLIGDQVDQQSSCIGRLMWDFSVRSRSNKWTRDMQLYRKSRWFLSDYDIDSGFALNVVKTKVRGIGKSFALHVETEPRRACHIYGWNLTLTNNSAT